MISVVIRTINEKERTRALLVKLKKQKSSQPFEIVVIDNESTDGTKEMAESYGAKVVTLPRNEFTYPKSMNLGVKNSSGEIVILTVGHALPISQHWIECASKNFEDEKTAGFYGPCLPRKGAHLLEFFIYSCWYLKCLILGRRVVKKAPGILGATNCAIRKKLWEKHPFDETYEHGGEDGEWASWAIQQGYNIVVDPSFVVRHSHPMKTLSDKKRQFALWNSMGQPGKFDREKIGSATGIKFEN